MQQNIKQRINDRVLVLTMAKEPNIIDILNISPSVALLRAHSCGMIIEFLVSVLNETSTISQENLYNRLAEYLNDRELDLEEGDNISVFDTYEEKAEKYIRKWTDSGYLTNYTNEEGEILYQLSAHTCKVIDWLHSLKREEYIGTESKFKSIIAQLKELVENTNENKQQRIQMLEKKKLEIEQKIQRLEMGDDVEVFDEYQIVPRFLEINKRAKELLSDFKDVDDNFKNIIREIYQKQIDPNLSKGGILQSTFDALDELKSSSQGKSFYAFWEFLTAREMQSELDDLINELFITLEERKIENNDLFLQNMVSSLYESGKKVHQSNDRMAKKLSHIIRNNEESKSDLTRQIIQEIKKHLMAIAKTGKKPDISLTVDDGLNISVPFERKLTFELSETREYTTNPSINAVSIEELNDLGKLFGNISIDRKLLEKNIRHILAVKGQTTISDIIQQHPLQQGLPELFAYFGILNHFSNTMVNSERHQSIVFDTEQNKRIIIPEIIISR